MGRAGRIRKMKGLAQSAGQKNAGGRSMAPALAIAAAAIAVAALTGAYMLGYFGPGAGPAQAEPPPNQTTTEIKIPVSSVGQSASYYTYDSSGVTVRFFAVKDPGGAVHLAADACDVCFRAKKGYSQEGDMMKCNNCGRTFAISNLGETNSGGGCWPSYLPMKVADGQVIVGKSDLDAKRSLFE